MTYPDQNVATLLITAITTPLLMAVVYCDYKDRKPMFVFCLMWSAFWFIISVVGTAISEPYLNPFVFGLAFSNAFTLTIRLILD